MSNSPDQAAAAAPTGAVASSESTSSPTAAELDSTTAQELAVEQAHVDKVYARLGELATSARNVAKDGRSLFQSDRANFVREEDGTGLFERDVFAFQAAKRLASLDAEHEGLVFGRLDRQDGEVRYVGRLGVRDEEYEPLVVDWRARAAEPFYRATPTDPMEVVRRRVLRCRGEQVIGIEDDLLDGEHADPGLVVVGEGALMAALSRSRGPRMKDIVATIQSEQDEAIRAPYQGFTMIAGGPGTGKTVVALHRAAYLLYSHRRRFENGGVLVVGPSEVFMNYIERVLPSLGEDSVTLRAIGQVASDVLRRSSDRVDSPAAAAIKGSLRMRRVLRRLVDDPSVSGTHDQLRVVVKGDALTATVDELRRIRADVLRHHKFNAGRPAAVKAVLGLLRRRWDGLDPAHATDDETDDEVFAELVSASATWQMFWHAWWPTLTATGILAQLADTQVAARVAGRDLAEREADTLAASIDPDHWTVADTALLDELISIVGPPPPVEDEQPETSLFLDEGASVNEVVTTADRLSREVEADPFAEPHATYNHVLVDEAQDITPMQWRMLRRRGSHASWTIVGDPAQSSWPDPDETARAMKDLVGNAPHRRFRMSTNYRSPAEVYDLAGRVVVAVQPDADLPTAVRSTGVEPDLRSVHELEAGAVRAAVDLAGLVEGSIGVIAPESVINSVREALTRAPELAEAGDRVVVVTPLESKGLEYDGVVVVSPDDIIAESPGGVRVLYVALTRPTQRLITLDRATGGDWQRSLSSPLSDSA